MTHLEASAREHVARPLAADDAARRGALPLVSILINNYNYVRFLPAAIDSALAQDYPRLEVIVVDDGSSDGSRDVIAGYGDKIIPIVKANGGQGSAFNAGFAASRGEILCFLDADDSFHPGKVSRIVDCFRQYGDGSAPIMIHHLLSVEDENGDPVEEEPYGRPHGSPMNLYAFSQKHRFIWFEAGPTTTISINRVLAARLFPIPEQGVRISADDFVVYGASLIGEVYSLSETLGVYRIHGTNNWYRSPRRKTAEFLDTLESYANAKLIEDGKAPTIKFDDSIYAWPGMVADHRWLALAAHMTRIVARDRDGYTLTFVYHTVMTIGMMAMKTFRAKRASLLGRLSPPWQRAPR